MHEDMTTRLTGGLSTSALGPRLHPSLALAVAAMIVIASIRGIFIINFPISATTVYQMTAGLLLLLAMYGFVKSGGYGDRNLVFLRRLLALNLALGALNIAVDVVLGTPVLPSVLYVYAAPYVIFLFLRLPSAYLRAAFAIIGVAIAYSVLDTFVSSLRGPAAILAYNSKLRPDLTVALSHTGDLYRAGGYTGSYHDSANILGMLIPFFFIRHLLKANLLDLGLFLFFLLAITLTQSAANIVLAVFSTLVFTGYVLVHRQRPATVVYLFVGMAGIASLGFVSRDALLAFATRLGSGGDWRGMARELDLNSLLSAVPFILVGHATGFGSQSIHTEVEHVKTIVQLGIVHAVILFWILLYPLACFSRRRSPPAELLPSLAAVSFGFMSLLHYGSLFRETSVFLFYALYSVSLGTILGGANSLGLVRPKPFRRRKIGNYTVSQGLR